MFADSITFTQIIIVVYYYIIVFFDHLLFMLEHTVHSDFVIVLIPQLLVSPFYSDTHSFNRRDWQLISLILNRYLVIGTIQ